jgi:hypothetical protein
MEVLLDPIRAVAQDIASAETTATAPTGRDTGKAAVPKRAAKFGA